MDSDVEKERRVNLFYLNGFFVEEILNKITSEIEEIIPFKSGYKLDYYLHNLHQRENDEEMLDVG